MGGDDGARFLEVAQLQGDRGADDLGLKLQRNGKRAHPVEPVVAGTLEELARGDVDGRLEGLIGSQDQGDGLDQRERRLMGDVGEGGVGGQAQRIGAAGEADVVGPDGAGGTGHAVVERRPRPDGDARQTCHRLDAAENLRRVEDALETLESGREIGDAKGIAAGVADGGLDNRRVAQIGRFPGHRPFHHHVAEPLLLVAGEEAGEHGIGIEAGKAPPEDAARACPPGRQSGNCR